MNWFSSPFVRTEHIRGMEHECDGLMNFVWRLYFLRNILSNNNVNGERFRHTVFILLESNARSRARNIKYIQIAHPSMMFLNLDVALIGYYYCIRHFMFCQGIPSIWNFVRIETSKWNWRKSKELARPIYCINCCDGRSQSSIYSCAHSASRFDSRNLSVYFRLVWALAELTSDESRSRN